MPKIKVEMEISKNDLRDLLCEDEEPDYEDFWKPEPEDDEEIAEIEAMFAEADKLRAQKNERAARAITEKPKAAKAKKPTKKEQEIREMASATTLPTNWHTIWTIEQLEALCEKLKAQPAFAFDTETLGVNPFKDMIVGMSFYWPDEGYYIPLMHNEHVQEIPAEGVNGVDYVHCLPNVVVAAAIKEIMEDPEKKIFTHNGKFDCHIMKQWMGIEFYPFYDTMIGCALLDETQSKRLKDAATLYLHVPSDRFSTLFGKVTFEKVPIRLNHNRTGSMASYYAIKDTWLTWDLAMFQGRALNRPGMEEIKKLLFEVEMPFLNIVIRSERKGVRLDSDYMINEVATTLRREVEELRQKIWVYTGEINLNSPAQVAEALYDKLGLPRLNEDKPNSTDKRTLGKLKKHHELIPMLLSYKQKTKLVTAFADKLPLAVVEGYIHTSFNPVGAKTGRMSANNPNLQQIPARIGNLIRNAFIADEGRLLASIDFGSQELRWLAHLSKDPVLMDIYLRGLDVHSMTAVGMWNMAHIDEPEVSYEDFQYRRGILEYFLDEDGGLIEDKLHPDNLAKLFEEGKIQHVDLDQTRIDVELGKKYEKYRKDAKVVNFGIIYGMSEYKLADTLEIDVESARLYISGYFAKYPGVQKWMAEQRKKMDKVKYTNTYQGRKRRVYAEMDSDKFWLRQRGYRMGINAIIQGSSAEQTKIASIKLQALFDEWAKEGVHVQILLWVHDEIIFDVPENIGMDRLRMIADVMCNAIQLDCGMKSDIEVGRKWGQKMSEDDLYDLTDDDDEEDDAA